MDSIETHLPVLERLVGIFNIESVLEFGMGFGSTPFFIRKCKKVTSIEMQNQGWFDLISSKYGNKCFTPLFYPGPESFLGYVRELRPVIDMCFVDGHGDSRWRVINSIFHLTTLIVVHDTEEGSYEWHKVKLPKEWSWKHVKKYKTWTSIITNDIEKKSIIEALVF